VAIGKTPTTVTDAVLVLAPWGASTDICCHANRGDKASTAIVADISILANDTLSIGKTPAKMTVAGTCRVTWTNSLTISFCFGK
jgi:hypothetical protein